MGALSAGGILGSLTGAIGLINTLDRTYQSIQNLRGMNKDSEALRRSQKLAMEQLIAQQNATMQSAADKAALDRETIAANAGTAETQRRNALKRAVARQKAAYGATGIGSMDGSGEAVLLGLFEESDQDRRDRDRLDGLRNLAIDRDLEDRQRINVLQRSQLAENQKLDRILSSY